MPQVDWRECLRYEVVDVIEHIRGKQADCHGPVRGLPGGAQVENPHGHAARIDESLQLDALGPAREAEIGPDAQGPKRVVRADQQEVTGAKRERPLGAVAGKPSPGVEKSVAEGGDEPVGNRRGDQAGIEPGDAGTLITAAGDPQPG